MLKYSFHEFSFGNYCLVIETNNTKIMTGSFFNENTVINMNAQRRLEPTKKLMVFTPIEEQIIRDIFIDLNILIVADFSSMMGFPYVLSKYNISTDKITFLSTEPIIQLAKSYMGEFYSIFNSFLIQQASSTLLEPITLITSNDIDAYMALFVPLAFNQRFNSLIKVMNPSIILSFSSSGYELGSFNILIEFFNKKIAVLTHSSLIANRYPLEFNSSALASVDYVIQFPQVINSTPQVAQYEKNLSQFISDCTSIFSKSSVHSSHYPYVFLIAEPWFMFEFIDILRFKQPKEVKSIYVSKSIDSLLKYSNVNLSFINEKSYRKIYDFMSPLSFDDLISREAFQSFESFEELLSNEKVVKGISKGDCPRMFIVNRLAFEGEDCTCVNLFQFFARNVSDGAGIDCLMALNYPFVKNFIQDINLRTYIVDYNITQEQYQLMIKTLKPLNVRVMKNDKDSHGSVIDYEALLDGISYEVYEINEANVIYFEENDIVYSNSFGTSAIKKSEDIQLNAHMENVRLFLSKVSKSSSRKSQQKQSGLKSSDLMELFEELLKQYLECNQMKLAEILYKVDQIDITISSSTESNESISVVKIKIPNEKEEPFIDISTESYKDALYLNTILSTMFTN